MKLGRIQIKIEILAIRRKVIRDNGGGIDLITEEF